MATSNFDEIFCLEDGGIPRAEYLIHHLHGALDAGTCGELACAQIVSSLKTRRVATFDIDKLVDYRARRPMVTISEWVLSDAAIPELALDLATDYDGKEFLILHGPEPDFRWGAFCNSICDFAQEAGVKTAVSLTGMPAAVPHTRPILTNVHSSSAKLVDAQAKMQTEIAISASADLYLAVLLGQSKIDTLGVVGAIPYYLTETEYPAGAATLLAYVAKRTGLSLPVGDLEAAATRYGPRLEEQMSSAPELGGMVAALEKHYDEGRESGVIPEASPAPLAVPSGDEIGRRFEKFLFEEASRAGLASGQKAGPTALVMPTVVGDTAAGLAPGDGADEASPVAGQDTTESTRANARQTGANRVLDGSSSDTDNSKLADDPRRPRRPRRRHNTLPNERGTGQPQVPANTASQPQSAVPVAPETGTEGPFEEENLVDNGDRKNFGEGNVSQHVVRRRRGRHSGQP